MLWRAFARAKAADAETCRRRTSTRRAVDAALRVRRADAVAAGAAAARGCAGAWRNSPTFPARSTNIRIGGGAMPAQAEELLDPAQRRRRLRSHPLARRGTAMSVPRATDAAAVPPRLHLRRCGRAGALLRRARHQPSLCLADPDGAAGLDARLRRDRSDAGQSGAWRRGRRCARWWRAAPPRPGADRRHRAEPHGGRQTATRGGSMCCGGPRQPLCANISISTGTPAIPHLHGKVLLPFLGRPYGEAWRPAKISAAPATSRRRSCHPLFRPRISARARCARRSSLRAGSRRLRRDSIRLADGRARLHRCWNSSTTGWPGGARANDEINWRRFFDINELVGRCAWRTPRCSRQRTPRCSASTPRA